MKILTAIGTQRIVEETGWIGRNLVKAPTFRRDQVGIAIKNLIRDQHHTALGKKREITVRECETAEQLAVICRSGYRPDLIVIALNTQIRMSAEEIDRLELGRFGCSVIVVVPRHPPYAHPTSLDYTIVICDQDCSKQLRALIDATAEAIANREKMEREQQWEANKKAEAAFEEKKDEEYKNLTNDEWLKRQEEAESRRRGGAPEEGE